MDGNVQSTKNFSSHFRLSERVSVWVCFIVAGVETRCIVNVTALQSEIESNEYNAGKNEKQRTERHSKNSGVDRASNGMRRKGQRRERLCKCGDRVPTNTEQNLNCTKVTKLTIKIVDYANKRTSTHPCVCVYLCFCLMSNIVHSRWVSEAKLRFTIFLECLVFYLVHLLIWCQFICLLLM